MELRNLHVIVEGLESLSAIEREHPVLGKQLFDFVDSVGGCCEKAYDRLSKALSNVRTLSSHSTVEEINYVVKEMNQAPNSKWFKDVAGICDRLAALASNHKNDFEQQISYADNSRKNLENSPNNPSSPLYEASYKISMLFSSLQRHEGDLKDDIRYVMYNVQSMLSEAKESGNYENVRNYSINLQKDIAKNVDEISKICNQIKGTKDVQTILAPEQIAENALRTPERMLILNMFFLVVLLSVGATIFQFLKIYQSNFQLILYMSLNHH